MKTVILDTTKAQTPKQIGDFLDKENINEGDTLSISSAGALNQNLLLGYLFIIWIAASVYFRLKKEIGKKKTDELLKKFYKDYTTPEQLQSEIEKELHIKIELPNDRDDWQYASALSLSNAYGEDEPDYDNVVVKEPNPEYKPWKKDL